MVGAENINFNSDHRLIEMEERLLKKVLATLNIALNAAEEDISLFFSFEMSKKQLLKRLAGLTGKIDSLKMKNPKREFHEEDWHFFKADQLQLLNFRLVITYS